MSQQRAVMSQELAAMRSAGSSDASAVGGNESAPGPYESAMWRSNVNSNEDETACLLYTSDAADE